MTEFKISTEYAHTFTTARKGTEVRTRITSKSNTVTGKVQSVERAKALVAGAFNYIDQFDMGSAIIETLAKKDMIRIWFVNPGSDALSPPGTQTNPTEFPVVKWSPLGITWFFDCGKSTSRRNAKYFPKGKNGGNAPFDGNLVVRANDPALVYDSSNPPHVMGAQSSPAVLLHELGHYLQYYMKPHYFKSEFIRAWRDNSAHLIEADGNMHEVPDIDAPWEVDNVNWNERPFIKSCRKAGICEGYKTHYSDSIGADPIDDMLIARVGDMLIPKIKMGDTWYHLNAAWKVKSATKVSQLYIKANKSAQKTIMNATGVKPYQPSERQIGNCFDKFLKPL